MASTISASGGSDGAVCFQFPNTYFEISNPVPYVLNAVFNFTLAIITTATNALVLWAIWKIPSLYLPSKMLLFNLALTDLTTGLITMPAFVMFLVSKVAEGLSHIRCLSAFCFATATSVVSCISLITITAISLDRCAAFHFRLKYREIVTARRTFLLIVTSWSFAAFYGTSCLWHFVLYGQLALATHCTSFFVTSLAYFKIHGGMRNHRRIQTHAGRDPSGTAEFNVAQYRRSAVNMLWIYGLFILCYLPYLCLMAVRWFVGPTVLVQCILEFTVTIMLFNSCLNPLLYCYRLPEIRSSVLGVLRKVFPKLQTAELSQVE